jgi:hypothetical protein
VANLLDSRPSASTLDVETLVKMAWQGQMRVPHFQRDFRWGWEDVRRLFDSIVKGYPVGSLLLWRRFGPQQLLRLGALEIDAPEIADSRWVVDGQQRLTSLANALHPKGQTDNRFALAYDLSNEKFVRTPTVENPLIVPLPVIFDLQKLLRWFADNPESSDYLDRASELTRLIRQFEIPLYVVIEENPEVLQDIFDRMNNYGKRLSRAEIFSALNAGDETMGHNAPSLEKIALSIQDDMEFGLIDNDTILAAILARRGVDIRRDIRHEFDDPKDEGRDLAYERGEIALRRAISFLQADAKVPHFTLLAYRYAIIALTRFFGLFPDPDDRTIQLLRRWYWRAAIAGPEQFKGGTPNAAYLMCAAIVPGHLDRSLKSLLDAVSSPVSKNVSLTRFSTREAATKMLLCAMWSKEPRNPTTAEPYTQAELAESLGDQATARFIAPQLAPKKAVPSEVSALPGNRLLMPSIDVDPVEVAELITRPQFEISYVGWAAVLESHVLTSELTELLLTNEYEEVVNSRQVLLGALMNKFAATMTEWQFEDTPTLARFEIADDDDE